MAGFDVQRVIAAFQQGRQIKDDKEKKVRDVEDRDFELKQRQAQLKLDNIQHQLMKRKLEQENLKETEGASGGSLQTPMAPTFQAPLPGDTEAPQRQQPEGSRSIPLPLPQMQVGGVEELGVPGYSRRPQSAEQASSIAEMLNQRKIEQTPAVNVGEHGMANPITGKMTVQPPAPKQVAPPRPTEGEVNRGLSAAFYKDRKKLAPDAKLSELQQAEADAEYESYKANLKKSDDSSAKAQKSAETKKLVDTVFDNPNLWDELSVRDKAEIAPDLAAKGFSGFGKPLPQGAVNKLAESKSAIAALQDLRAVLVDNEQYIGPLAGLQALNPYSEGRKAQADIDRVKQRVGKALEGGVLRKEDEEKYKRILATLRDTPETAIYKTDQLIEDLARDIDIYVEEQRAAGRKVGSTTSTAKAPIVQRSPSTGAYRYSTDGGKTWLNGQPPK